MRWEAGGERPPDRTSIGLPTHRVCLRSARKGHLQAREAGAQQDARHLRGRSPPTSLISASQPLIRIPGWPQNPISLDGNHRLGVQSREQAQNRQARRPLRKEPTSDRSYSRRSGPGAPASGSRVEVKGPIGGFDLPVHFGGQGPGRKQSAAVAARVSRRL